MIAEESGRGRRLCRIEISSRMVELSRQQRTFQHCNMLQCTSSSASFGGITMIVRALSGRSHDDGWMTQRFFFSMDSVRRSFADESF